VFSNKFIYADRLSSNKIPYEFLVLNIRHNFPWGFYSVLHPHSHAIQHWIRVFHQFFLSRLQLSIISSFATYQNVAHLFSRVCAWRVSVVFLPNKIMRIHACCAVY